MSKYVFITKVEKTESNLPKIEVAKDDHPVPFGLYPKLHPEKTDVYFETETIKAKAFKDGRGNVIYIGLCKEAQDTIGVWLESFENLQEAYNDLYNEYCKSIRQNRELVDECNFYVNEVTFLRKNVEKGQEKLKFYRNMNFWQRLRFLFKIW